MKTFKNLFFSLLAFCSFSLSAQAKDFRIKFEVYSVNREYYKADRESMAALVLDSKAKVITAAEIISPSGQRGKAEATKEIIYAVGGDSSGVEVESRLVGSVIEYEAILGGDNHTVDLTYSVDYTTAAPENEWRKIPVGGGFNVEDPHFSKQQLVSSGTFYNSDKWILLGTLPEVTSETDSELKKVFPVYAQIQLRDPDQR
ncbi:MAG: hypothetical protein R3A80_06935 [Bdellovibrionota bacterium]